MKWINKYTVSQLAEITKLPVERLVECSIAQLNELAEAAGQAAQKRFELQRQILLLEGDTKNERN